MRTTSLVAAILERVQGQKYGTRGGINLVESVSVPKAVYHGRLVQMRELRIGLLEGIRYDEEGM